ncbi:hypothetical protein BDA96_10G005600 [Sorghum bicolor]|uniref:Uncharacterized protein n=1 Tax=Sorghum bicolor TaxID=4558 RepID=A0A921PZ79_SORBI|nr:hypothetical protein BDA96_10G005600 [Sorghum bicolor]
MCSVELACIGRYCRVACSGIGVDDRPMPCHAMIVQHSLFISSRVQSRATSHCLLDRSLARFFQRDINLRLLLSRACLAS